MTSTLYKKSVPLVFPNFVKFDQFGTSQYLKSFRFRVHLGNLIPAKKFIWNSFATVEISHLNSALENCPLEDCPPEDCPYS